MLGDILQHSNLDLLREVEQLLSILVQAKESIPLELDSYYNYVFDYGKKLRRGVEQNLSNLNLGQDFILRDVLSDTQKANRAIRLFDERLVHPILRVRPSDRFCLRLLLYLHSAHPETEKIPLAFSDGAFGCWAVIPTIYFIPSSAQQGLLYLPLLFHEFGHLLYARHKPEMDDLVRSLQEEISELLEPSFQRDDFYAQREAAKRSVIVETWYAWTQELFCDAVGLVIGGKTFIHAFSRYQQMYGRGEYHVKSTDLDRRTHPVTWIRTRLLADRARQMGYSAVADKLEDTWSAISRAMGIVEDYYGFYESEFLPAIQQTIDDMVVEAEPRNFANKEVFVLEEKVFASSPIQLLNQAWCKFLQEPKSYSVWEKSAITAFLGSN